LFSDFLFRHIFHKGTALMPISYRVADLKITGAHLVTPWGLVKGDLAVAEGKMIAFGDTASRLPADVTHDATGLHVLPGIIDSQVHFREPGLEYKEDLATGTLGALAGGVTTIFEMPNTKPSTTTAESMAHKMSLAKDRCWSHYAFYMGAADDNLTQLAELEMLEGVCGVKLFMGASTGSLLVPSDEGLELAMRHGRRRMALHAEDNYRLSQRRKLVDVYGAGPALHPHWRDELSCLYATQRVLALAEKTGRAVHVLHVTTAEEMVLLGQNKHLATVEVTPQHLTLAAPHCYEHLGTLAQMNPPIREERHRDALWWAIQQGIVDVLGSDHAPHTLEEKALPYPKSPSGMPGVQTMLPLMLNHVHEERLSLERLVDLLCHGPQRVFQLKNKGRLALGYDADLTLVDLNAKRTITREWIKTKSGWSPFEGMHVTGWPKAVYLKGKLAMQDDEIIGQPQGQPCRFWDVPQQR
jgi:dihydroorotase